MTRTAGEITRPSSPDLNGEQSVIERHLRVHAAQYYPHAAGNTDVTLIRSSQRAAAGIYWFRIGSPSEPRIVIAKVPRERADAMLADAADRPRLVEPPSLAIKFAREHRALERLQQRFSDAGDARFGAVPLLDRVDGARAIIMGLAEGRSMNHLSPQLSRLNLREPSRTLRRAVRNAGAWLRAYHQLDLDGAGKRQARRGEFIELVNRYCDHLGSALSRTDWFADVAEVMTAAAERIFDEELPLGLAHGDFAMRNILVGKNGRVVVLDTTALWAAPVYEDLAKFGLAMRVSRAQVYSGGLAFSEKRLAAAHGWLLAGYYGEEPVPEAQIRLYGLLLLLDKWSFEIALGRRRPIAMNTLWQRRLTAWFTRLMEDSVRSFALAPHDGWGQRQRRSGP